MGYFSFFNQNILGNCHTASRDADWCHRAAGRRHVRIRLCYDTKRDQFHFDKPARINDAYQCLVSALMSRSTRSSSIPGILNPYNLRLCIIVCLEEKTNIWCNLISFWVLPSLQRVLFAFGAGDGHCGDSPLHVDDQLQSDSDLHCTL